MTAFAITARPAASGTATAVTRWLLGGVAFAAGVVGVAMLAWPGSTGRFFSWQLAPPALAAFVGACYVASALVFGRAAASRSWPAQRGLCVAVLGLAAPTLIVTAVHRDVFDFERWQAVAWVALFATSVTSFGSLVLLRPAEPAAGPRLPAPARVVLVATAFAYGTVAVVLWAAPRAVASHGPIAAGPMGLRFVGSWAAFLALCAVRAARHPAREASELPVAALVAFPLAVLPAVLLHLDELRRGPAAALVAGLLVLATAGLSVQRAGRKVESPPTRGGAVR